MSTIQSAPPPSSNAPRRRHGRARVHPSVAEIGFVRAAFSRWSGSLLSSPSGRCP